MPGFELGFRSMAQISEVMTDDVLYVEANASIRKAIAAMHDADIRHVPVLDAGELVGILSDRDLRQYEASIWDDQDAIDRMRDHLDGPVSQVMSSNLHMVGPEDDLVDAIELMVEHKVGAVPVVDPSTRELVGIVSYIDVLRHARHAV
jgi:acetoin utilization protein AcuB